MLLVFVFMYVLIELTVQAQTGYLILKKNTSASTNSSLSISDHLDVGIVECEHRYLLNQNAVRNFYTVSQQVNDVLHSISQTLRAPQIPCFFQHVME